MKCQIKELKVYPENFKFSDWNTDHYNINLYEVNKVSDYFPYKRLLLCVLKNISINYSAPQVIATIVDLDSSHFQRDCIRRFHPDLHIHTVGKEKGFTTIDYIGTTPYKLVKDFDKFKPKTVLEALQIYGS